MTKLNRRQMIVSAGAATAYAAWTQQRPAPAAQGKAAAGPAKMPRLRAAALQCETVPPVGLPSSATSRYTSAVVQKVAGPLKTAVILLEDGQRRLCLVTTDFGSILAVHVTPFFRRAIADELKLPIENVLLFSSHNHSDVAISNDNRPRTYSPSETAQEPNLSPIGRELLDQLRSLARRLPGLLQPVTVWWAEGSEGRITYNRKGRRADGSTYFMREEDRDLVGRDYNGDIDRQAPIVVLKNQEGKPVVVLAQFTGHPITSYHPERPVVFGEWPRVACDMVAEHFQASGPVVVGFLQGCAGDVNSKELFRGGVERSIEYGKMLGQTYIQAMSQLRPSGRDGMDYAVEKAGIPLAAIPSEKELRAEIVEMEDFIRRAAAGDEDTLACVGLNFPRALSPSYRGKLVEAILPWSRWALECHTTGRADSLPRSLDTEVYVLRLGDVGIVGMPFEPFQGIGRQIRRRSPLPLTIPCGYANASYGYLTDDPNTGDREYMSSFYRYTKFRSPYAKPAGDVLADKGVEVLRRFVEQSYAR